MLKFFTPPRWQGETIPSETGKNHHFAAQSKTRMKPHYSVQILWSQEDGAYLAEAVELPGCMADGTTPEEALSNLSTVISEWIEAAKEDGRTIPEPMTAEQMEKRAKEFQDQIQKHIAHEVNAAVGNVLQQIAASSFRSRQSIFHVRGEYAISTAVEIAGTKGRR